MIPICILRRWLISLITIVASLHTGGCAIGTIESDIHQEVAAVRTQLKKGITRAEVREILGSPYFQNEPLRVEAYRKTGTDVEIGVAIFVPMALPADKHTYHFFIAYNEKWEVLDWQVGGGALRLEAADLVLVAAKRRASPSLRHPRNSGAPHDDDDPLRGACLSRQGTRSLLPRNGR